MIPYGRQSLDKSDEEAVLEVLRSDWLTQGPTVTHFEQALSEQCAGAAAVAVSNGTVALTLACQALGLGPGGRLWTSPNTFVASANCGRYCGAEVGFVDIDLETGNMSVEALERALQDAERSGTLPDIVIPVHFAGLPCAMEKIARLGKRYGFRIIEDACHAVGASLNGDPVGDCRYSDATVFSFHPVKIITTGEGGAILCRDSALETRLRLLASHGITRDPEQMHESAVDDPWYYQQVTLGVNARITDLQAALGVSQMRRLRHFVQRRERLAARYDDAFEDLPLHLPWRGETMASAWHLYVIRIDADRTPIDRREAFLALRERGIGVNVHYIPVHTQPYYRARGFSDGDFPNAEQHYRQCITLPLFPAMRDDEQARVITAVKEIFS
ncbi:MAG: UDP-4-amino-4,6-dideoxy-N-acetyl-beta-L-altrosamine transaminase [Magnetococcales bacterium]|nr:UDP-4-amino-4,6-dideoxy-N-acetyl-beta-L-altrosamine transaminase [Magnetococcales bacterium]